MTSMENNTMSSCENGECGGCAPDALALVDFRRAIRAVGGKWKLEILLALMDGVMRFGALRRALNGVTQHMLTTQLRELERDGLVSRTVVANKPLHVEYELTEAAHGLAPAFTELLAWSKTFGKSTPARAVTRSAGFA